MNDINIVMFDLDGVLLDSESDLSWLKSSITKTLNHFNITPSKENLDYIHFKNIEQFKRSCLNLGVDPEVVWPVRNKFYIAEKLNAMKNGIIKPYPDVQDIYKLDSMYTIGIISNSPQIIVDSFVSMFGFSDLFSLNIGRGNTFWDIEHIKPDPYLFSLLENMISVENIAYIGDMESDRIFAERNNMNYYHLDRDNNHKHGYDSLSEIVRTLENGK